MTTPRTKRILLTVCGVLIGIVLLALAGTSILNALSYDPQMDYLSILKSSPAYDDAEKSDIAFSYETKDTPGLTQIRQSYALDSVGGSGSTFDRAVNVMKWEHSLISYDGSQIIPSQKDAITLIAFGTKPGSGLNCGGMAIVLSEALLSMDIKARIVELRAKNLSTEIHVVTAVYLPETEQWVFLDPSYQAYFKDAFGRALGFPEIRNAMISGGFLKVNPEMNFNGEPVELAGHMHYLSKNMYRFSSPRYSGFGSDSAADKVMIVLNPVGDNTGRTPWPFSNDVIIHNPDVFWAKPSL